MDSKVAPVLAECRCKCAYTAPPNQQQQQSQSQSKRYSQKQQQEKIPNDRQHNDSLALLQLKVRSLEKYKTNYELLCSQLGELNAQIGLQLEQHETDVSSLNATVAALQSSNSDLERALRESQSLLETQRQVVQQDRAYSERVHSQLSTAAELLKATEKRIESKEQTLASQVKELQTELEMSQKENEALTNQSNHLQDKLLTHKQSFSETLQTEAQKREKLRFKLTQRVSGLQSEVDSLTSELETQRSLTRNAKKQLAHQTSENEALKKQLGGVKSDVESLSVMLDKQQQAANFQDQKQIRYKKQVKQAEVSALRAKRQLESLQEELTNTSEELVRKNASVEALQSELRALRAQFEQQKRELDHSISTINDLKAQVASLEEQNTVERGKLEEQERLKVLVYRKELHQMRQLLAVNHQKASQSSKDVQKLKQELFGVQEMLHAYHSKRDSWRQYIDTEDTTSEHEEEEERRGRGRVDPGKAEESVLKCAIMEQVRAATVHSASVRTKKGRLKK